MNIAELTRLSYQHLITGAKSRTADDFLGGILADDMGLGKTLIALAAILASYDRAADFGSQRSDAETEYHASCMRSQATVVVVPSECQWLKVSSKRLDIR